MTTLAEIEAAADALPASDQRQLMAHLSARLQDRGASQHGTSALSPEQIVDWMAEDEATMRRFHPSS